MLARALFCTRCYPAVVSQEFIGPLARRQTSVQINGNASQLGFPKIESLISCASISHASYASSLEEVSEEIMAQKNFLRLVTCKMAML